MVLPRIRLPRRLFDTSVNIEAKILTASADAAATAKTAVAAEMGDAAAASAFLGITVEQAPSVRSQDEVNTELSGESEPCFPSSSMVMLGNGSAARLGDLKEGDEILAATSDGRATTGTVSLFSVAKPEAEATFLTLTASSDFKITITPEHHLPIGETCCSNLKQAKDVAVGDTVWSVSSTAVTAHTVTSKGLTIEKGLHSPVLANGAMPVVDGLATAFDSAWVVKLASYALPYALPSARRLARALSSDALLLSIPAKSSSMSMDSTSHPRMQPATPRPSWQAL